VVIVVEVVVVVAVVTVVAETEAVVEVTAAVPVAALVVVMVSALAAALLLHAVALALAVLAEDRLLVHGDADAGHLAGARARLRRREEQGPRGDGRQSQPGDPPGGPERACNVHGRWFPFMFIDPGSGLSNASRQRRT